MVSLSNGWVLAHPQELLGYCAAVAQNLQLGSSPSQKKFTWSCNCSISGIMTNHNTHLAPGFTLNVLASTPVNVAILWGLLCLTNVLPAGETPLPVWPKDPSDLALCIQGFALPTGAPPGIELQSFRLCTPPVHIVFMKLSPLLFPFYFFFSFSGGCFHSGFFSPAALSASPFLSLHLHPLSSSRNSSLPSTAFLSSGSPLHAAYLPSSVVQVVQIVVLILNAVS